MAVALDIILDGPSRAYLAAPKDMPPPVVSIAGEACLLTKLSQPQNLLIGRNLIWNADFNQGAKGWDRLSGTAAYTVGLDLNDRFTLDQGHTLYVRAAPDVADSEARVGARYTAQDGNAQIPIIGGCLLKIKALVGMLRCNAFLEICFLDRNGAALETIQKILPRGQKLGGRAREDYEALSVTVESPPSAAFATLTVGIDRSNILSHEDRSASDVAFFMTEIELIHTLENTAHPGFGLMDEETAASTNRLIQALSAGQTLYSVDVASGGTVRLESAQAVTLASRPPQIDGIILHANDNVFAFRFRPRPDDLGQHQFHLHVDEQLIAVSPVTVQGDEDWLDVKALIPNDLMDGNPHGLDVRDQWGRSLAAEVRVLRMIQTDWFDILKHTTPPHQGKLSPTAQMRYQSLEVAMGSLQFSADPARDSAEFSHAHKVLVRGWAYLGPDDYTPITFAQHSDPDVSIVVPVHNKPHVTYSCLAALKLAVCDATFEIIVVDDGSDASTATMLASVSGITVVRHETAKGFNGAVNAGAARARGQYIALLNNDTEVTAGWLDELIWPFDCTDLTSVGMTGAKLIYPNGRLQEAGGMINADGQPYLYGRLRNSGDPRYNYTRDVDYVSGAALLIETSLFHELGGLSEYLAPAYWEDVDLAFKVRAAGQRVLYAPKALVIHHEGLSHGRDAQVDGSFKQYQNINAPKFKKQWAHALTQQHAPTLPLDLAKDRGTTKRVLFIDNEVPRPDFDAGSYAAIQEIRMFQALGYKVSFLPANRAYLGKYTEDLQRMGVEVLFAPFVRTVKQHLAERGSEYDLVFITRYYVAQHFIRAIRREAPQAKILFNNADCHFLRETRAALVMPNAEDREKALTEAKKIQADELAVMRSVDLNFSYNDTEIEILTKHLMDEVPVAKLPWVQELVKDRPPMEGREGIMFLGGFGHKPNIEAVHFLAAEVMPRLAESNPEIILFVYGSRTTDEIRALDTENIRIMGQIPDVKEAFDRHRLFVAPLLSGAGIKGKVLNAMSHGIPCLLSDMAAEGIAGLNVDDIVTDPQAWPNAIKARLEAPNQTVKTNSAMDMYSLSRGTDALGAILKTTFGF